jgi:hypothetical protein
MSDGALIIPGGIRAGQTGGVEADESDMVMAYRLRR